MPTSTVGKLKRSAHLFYIDTTFGGSTPSWYLVGKDVEDMSIELNPDVETKKNILDETTVNDNGYEPSISVDTYYANPSDGDFYTKIKDIAMNRKTGDSCKTKILERKLHFRRPVRQHSQTEYRHLQKLHKGAVFPFPLFLEGYNAVD